MGEHASDPHGCDTRLNYLPEIVRDDEVARQIHRRRRTDPPDRLARNFVPPRMDRHRPRMLEALAKRRPLQQELPGEELNVRREEPGSGAG